MSANALAPSVFLGHTETIQQNLGGIMPVTKKKQAPKKKPSEMRSFVRASNTKPFVTFKITQQTVYWLIIGGLVLGFGIWVMYLTVRIHSMYDDIQSVGPNTHMNVMRR